MEGNEENEENGGWRVGGIGCLIECKEQVEIFLVSCDDDESAKLARFARFGK